jgi:Na+/proline symporter
VSCLRKKLWLPVLLALTARQTALACATCYGASDSALAQGMNWGIVTLLGVIGAVLFGITAFFVHLGIKSARLNAAAPVPNPTDSKS